MSKTKKMLKKMKIMQQNQNYAINEVLEMRRSIKELKRQRMHDRQMIGEMIQAMFQVVQQYTDLEANDYMEDCYPNGEGEQVSDTEAEKETVDSEVTEEEESEAVEDATDNSDEEVEEEEPVEQTSLVPAVPKAPKINADLPFGEVRVHCATIGVLDKKRRIHSVAKIKDLDTDNPEICALYHFGEYGPKYDLFCDTVKPFISQIQGEPSAWMPYRMLNGKTMQEGLRKYRNDPNYPYVGIDGVFYLERRDAEIEAASDESENNDDSTAESERPLVATVDTVDGGKMDQRWYAVLVSSVDGNVQTVVVMESYVDNRILCTSPYRMFHLGRTHLPARYLQSIGNMLKDTINLVETRNLTRPGTFTDRDSIIQYAEAIDDDPQRLLSICPCYANYKVDMSDVRNVAIEL